MLSIDSIRYLCFGVGGANGWAYVGVLEALETEMHKNNLTLFNQLKGISGSSIGSIVSLAIMLQYNSVELHNFILSVTQRFKSALAKKNVLDLFDRKGIMDTKAVEDLVKSMITTKLGPAKADITFSALFEHTHKVLAIGAYNITMERSEILDYQSMPTLPVWKAVCMSCAIPFYFFPLEQNNCLYVDPGLSEPVPYTVFPLQETLVCYIQGHHGYAPPQNISIMDFICRVMHGVEQSTHVRMQATSSEHKMRFLKLRLPCSNSSITDGFDLSQKHQEQLMEIGRTTTLSLFHYKNALITQALIASAHASKFKTSAPSLATISAAKSVSEQQT